MRFDPIDSMEGRHLVMAYVTVAVVQLGYFAHVALQWVKLTRKSKATGV